jgi:hypothetical protein
MNMFLHSNAKVIKLLVCVLFFTSLYRQVYSQEENTGGDPISEAIKEQKQEQYLGSKLTKNEEEELKHIYEKYKLTDRQVELKSKERSGQKIKFFDRFRIAMANRKNYMREKKLKKFREKKVLSKQSEKTRERMKKNHKRTKDKYKRKKRKQKRKRFFNLFR